jgi:uncharacterized protein (TIGR03435 family)
VTLLRSMRLVRPLTVAAVVAAGAIAVTGQTPRGFDAASVKRNSSGAGLPGIVAVTGQRVSAPFVTVRTLVQSAYGVDRDQVVNGPGWIDTDRFEVTAIAPAGASLTDVRAMLRALLGERFGLSAHTEQRDLPVDILTFTGQLGPKMRRSGPECAPGAMPPGFRAPPPPPPPTPAGAADMLILTTTPTGSRCGSMMINGFISGRELPVANLAWMLSQQVRRPVLDRTGLAGKYDFDLMYLPDVGPPQVNGTALPWDAPALATAIREQLGLKFDSSRAPVNVVVIDRVTPPTDN